MISISEFLEEPDDIEEHRGQTGESLNHEVNEIGGMECQGV